MNDYAESIAACELSVTESARAFPGNIYLPEKVYEALPAAYVSTGGLFILGAAYIGIGHWAMVGYLALGLTCLFAGIKVQRIRRKMRATR